MIKIEAGDPLLTKEHILSIPDELCPMMVFSFGIGSPIATAIAMKEHGVYNHFMWLLSPGWLATQEVVFRMIPVENYMGKYALKFVYNKMWQIEDREKLREAIKEGLAKPWYRRLYDPLAIAGQALNLEWLQIPGLDICSDKGKYLKLVDRNYNLKYPSPTNINNWMKKQEGYTVYGRYRLD